jgi:predicted nucleic acid-binding protein
VLVLLDSGPLGLLANPTTSGPAREARDWATERIGAGDHLVIPEIADYEVRRELLRANRVRGLERLEELCAGLAYQPLTTTIMRAAATMWADARNRGNPTAHDLALDGDVILAAQAQAFNDAAAVVVATTNTKHLKRYVDARLWSDFGRS